MKPFLQKIILICVFFSPTFMFAQEKWSSPEVAQMYADGVIYIAAGNYTKAIITFKQALLLDPGKTSVLKKLGRAQYLSGNYDDAVQTINSIGGIPGADDECYQLQAACFEAQKHYKQASAVLQAGMVKYPYSGLLYHERGHLYYLQREHEDALAAWLDGIAKDPGYPLNYYEASLVYLGTNKVVWGLLYGEIFLNMEHDTIVDLEIKKKLFAGYKTLFDNIAENKPGAKQDRDTTNFEAAVLRTYSMLTPVVSDGISTTRLTMVRTRFLMDWFSVNSSKFPFSLFSYQDELIRTGHFDIYNEWLFGEAENIQEYKAWNVFHEGDMNRFKEWQKSHRYRPVTRDFYYRK
jgi:tetratricopeptide (TPR) repeat protein